MSIVDDIKKLLGGAARGGAQTFVRETDTGQAIVKDTVREYVYRAAPWLLLGGVLLAFVLTSRKRGR